VRRLILGIGNPIRGDDALGIVVAERLRPHVDADVSSGCVAGLGVLDEITGYDEVIVIDAIHTGRDAPGTVRRRELHEGPVRASGGAHEVGFPTVLAVGRRAGYALPERMVAYTMEAADLGRVGEELSAPVRAAVDGMVQRVLRDHFSPQAPEPPREGLR
jgi:hydrogenase maturation protease